MRRLLTDSGAPLPKGLSAKHILLLNARAYSFLGYPLGKEQSLFKDFESESNLENS